MTGKIKRVMDKGFGFITSDESEKDIFFHFSQLVDVDFDQLQEGDAVQFEIEDSPRGPQAVNISLASATDAVA